MITDTVKGNGLTLESPITPQLGVVQSKPVVRCIMDEERRPHRYICNHEYTTTSNGYVICTTCGTCLERQYTPYSYVVDHQIMRVGIHTTIGNKNERNKKYNNLNRGIYKPRIGSIDRLYQELKQFLSTLGMNSNICDKMYDFMRYIYKDITKQQSIGRLKTFIPAMSFVVFKNIGLTVTKREILEVSNITQRNMNQAISKIRLEMGL